MTTEHDARLREALARIAEIAAAATQGGNESDGDEHGAYREGNNGDGPTGTDLGCWIKVLPARLMESAAATARAINPVNAPLEAPLGRVAPLDPERLTVSTAHYWGPAPRQFTRQLRRRHLRSTGRHPRSRRARSRRARSTTGTSPTTCSP